MHVMLIGDSTTETFVLNSNGPINNPVEKFEITSQANVGDVWSIELSILENSGEKYLFKELEVKKGIFKYVFRPQAFLAEDKTYVLEATGSRDWKLHVKKLQNKTCSGLLRIRLTGSVRRSQWVIFAHKGLSPTEKAFEFPINTTDVGKIETVEFSRLTDEADASSECEITELYIEKLPLKKLAFHYKITEPILSLKVLKIRLEKELIMSNVDSDDDEGTRTLANEVADEGVASAPSLKGEVPLEDLEYKKKSSLKESESLNISEKFQQVYDGSQCYSNDTLSQVVTFDDCEATLDAVEHFDIQQTGILQVFQGKKSVLVRCTKPCFYDKQDESKDIINKKVRGITLHPLKENPCRAAYVDRAMPRYGGLIQVSLAPGSATDIPIKPLGYTGQMFIKNVEIDPVGASDMYYYVTPVDNIDRISNLVRILDNEGRLATKGFLEVNIEGEWVAACQMSHKAVPRMACQALGFEYGEVLKERDEDKVFISTFNKKFRQKAPRKNIMCGNTPKTLDDCFLFEEAKCQDPAADLFLRCTNFQPFSSLKDKTEIGKLNESGETELHVKFVHEKTENEEVVQDDLDYCLPTTLDNNIITALNTLCHYKQFKNYAGVQGEPLEKPTCWDISSCQDCGYDVVDNIVKTLKNADQNTKKLVLRCGERADIAKPEPLSGYIRSDVPPVKSLDCSDTLKTLEVEDKYALGQPGASFLVYCPAECASMSDKKVSGSSYFTEDTSICAAALYRDLESNLLQLTIGYPMVVFKENLENNGVSSQPADLNASPDKKFSVSFTVTEYTPCLLAAVNDELIVNPKQPDATSFFQIKSNLTSRLKNAHQKRVQNKVKLLSFIQLGADGPEAATLGQQWYWNYFFGSIPKSYYYSEKYEGLNSVNTNVYPNFSKEQWTLFFGYRMMDRPPNGGKANVLRLDGPVGVAIVVKTADNLTTMVLQTFTDGIVDKSYKLTFYVDENQATVDYYTLIFKDKTLSAMKNGKHATIPEFTLGSVAQVNSNQAEDKLQFLVDASFSGWVRYLAFFETALDQNVLKDLSSKVELFKPPEKKTVSDVTTDDRMCKSECSSDPVPVSGNNAGKAEAAELNSRVEVEVVQNEKSDRTCYDSGSEFVQCRLNMNDMSAMAEDFPDFLEHQTYRICCHSSSSCESGWQALELAEANEDYGFKINPPGNSVCQAARRENLLMPGQITEVFFTITKIPVNNVEKKAALGFRVSAAPPLPLLSCYETLDQNEKLFGGKNGKKYGLQCPKGCFTRYKSKPVEKAPMAGNSEIGYSEDSAVCYAALHAGLLSDSYPRELNIEIKSESAPIRFECGATCDAFGVRAGSRRWQRGFKFVETTRMNNTTLYHDPKMASKSSLAPKDKSFHMSKNTKISDFGISNKKTYDNQKPSTVEEEYISNMQQQVYLLESENKLLHDREGEREKLMGLELSDGQPLNEHMVQLKLKYERCKSDLENAIENKKGMKNDMYSNINALKLELEKSQGNCTQLKKKADKTQMRIEEENTTFRERKDEIQNEVSRCAKTNKQATNDLLETKNEVNELINKKREIERKIEDDNKKFREIEGEKIKKITELNRDLAAAQERFALLQIDKRDDVSVKDISSKCRELQIDIDEKKSQVETEKGNVIKTEKQIEVMEEMIKSNYDTIAKKEMTLKRLNNEITELKDDKYTEALKQRVENHEKVMINKLRIETDQEQIRTDEFFDYIKRIETDTNKYRNSYIKECNDKDELKNSYGKLDDQYKKQAGEISRLMHECAEKELILKDLSEKEERMAKELSALKINDSKNEMKIRQMKSEIETLREKSNNMERFKNIDFEEISSIYNNNMKMSNHIADFINKFQGSKSYRDSNNNNNDHR